MTPELRAQIAETLKAHGVDLATARNTSFRTRTVANARVAVIRLCREAGMTFRQIGAYLQCDAKGAWRALSRDEAGTRAITVPERADPLVREFFRIARDEDAELIDVAERSGVHRQTIDGWRRRSSPSVGNLQACFNAIGYRLAVLPLEGGKR